MCKPYLYLSAIHISLKLKWPEQIMIKTDCVIMEKGEKNRGMIEA